MLGPQGGVHVAMRCEHATQLSCTSGPSLQGCGILEASCGSQDRLPLSSPAPLTPICRELILEASSGRQDGLPSSSPAPVTPVCRGWGFWRRAVAARTDCHSPVAGRGALPSLKCCRVMPNRLLIEVLQPGHGQGAGYSRRGERSIYFSLHSAAARRVFLSRWHRSRGGPVWD